MYILGSLCALVGVFALFVTTRPAAFRITRSLTIDATPAAVFALINDFREWAAWSPWDQMDPSMTRTYEGPSAGKGAIYRWNGNNKVGQGSMTIQDTTSDSRVVVELRFVKPFAATNTATFTLEPSGSSTKVTWAMEGHNGFAQKAFGVFVNMDSLVGRDFEKGLAAMQSVLAKKV